MEELQPPLNFSELKDPQKADNVTTSQPSAANSSARRNVLPERFVVDSNGVNPFVRFATDAIGQELQPHASIWSMYVEEASEQDAELVDVQNKNLDLMLLFAALFSAILTAFLIESTNMLQQNPLDTSTALLLFITQSQRRLELGIPAQTIDPIDSTTPFSPTLTARFINGLWFTALTFSLSAALIAMLAKEWLAAYLASSIRPAYDRALARQVRFGGLVAWGALPIIAFLPILLHLSLLLFSLGLVIYLWNLDTGIAVVVLIITGLTLAFYIVTLFLGALFEPCPFVTQLSKYFRAGFKAYFKDWSPRRAKFWAEAIVSHSSIKETESHALSWLIKNSHDPAVVDCAYQAVASHIGVNTKRGDEFYENALRMTQTPAAMQHLITTPITLKDRIWGPKARFVDQGLNTAIARYALALPKALRHIIENIGIERATQCIRHATEANLCMNSGDPSPISLASTALRDLDTAFSNQWGPMSADMYALLSASHLELTEIIASTLRIHTPPPSRSRSPLNLGPLNLDSYRANEILGPSMTVISLLQPSQHEHLLQASKVALARASSQLQYHLNTQARISLVNLASLLKAVSKVMACSQLKMEADRRIDTAGADIEPPGEIRIGLSLLLTQTILKMIQDTQIARVPEFFSIAHQALAATASLCATTRPGNLTEDYWKSIRTDTLIDGPPTGIDMLPLPPATDPSQVVVIRQVLALSALPLTTYNCLPITALSIIYDQVKDTHAWFNIWGSLQHGQLVEQWIHEAYKLQFDCSVERHEESAKMARRSTLGIIGHVLLSKLEQLPVHWLDISWDTCLPPLLYLISSTPDQPELEVLVILDYLASSDQPSFESLIKFFNGSKGFSTLRSIRSHSEFYYQTTRTVIALLNSRKLQVSEDNANTMLDEVNFSLELLGRNTPEATSLIESALYYLAEAHHKGIVLPWDHSFILENNLETRIRDYIEDEPLKMVQPEATQSKDPLDVEN